MSDPVQAVLSVDTELFSHTPAVRNAAGSLEDAGVGLDGISFLRDAFADREITSTWFVVADIATDHSGVIEGIAADGHEIGSHTKSHRLLTDLDPDTRQRELVESKGILEATTGETVEGFRAPAFDIGPDHFERLAAAGYRYDSSVVASRKIPGWYGGEFDRIRPGPATAVDPGTPAAIAELPVSVMPGLRLPLTGTWLRFFGPRYTIYGMKWLARQGIPAIVYVHPWEFVDLPAVPGVPKRVYYHTGAWMRRAVERILETDLQFESAKQVLADSDLVSNVEQTAEGTQP